MSLIIGVDVGTGNLVVSKFIEENNVEIGSMRNMFLPIDPSLLTTSEIANTELDYVESFDDDGDVEKIYILGEDAYKFGNIFNQTVCRPMSKGVISSKEIDAIDVLTMMCEKLSGKSDGGVCVYSVPAQAIDIDIPPVLYHERVFNRIFKSLGYKPEPLNEGMAVVYSNCAKESYSGIGISFGAGLTNIACAYKGTQTSAFSVSRGGDWVDNSVAESLSLVSNKVTSVKENNLDLLNPATGKKKEKRVREALQYYYESLIEYVLDVIADKFDEDSDGLGIDGELPIVISGGTSLPEGFLELFREVFESKKDFPYEISEIRRASDPLNAVAIGCMMKAYWDNKELLPKPKTKKSKKAKGETNE